MNCYDNDDAGNPAAAKLAPELAAKGIIVVRAKLPAGKDINDVAREKQEREAALAIVLESTPRGSNAGPDHHRHAGLVCGGSRAVAGIRPFLL